MPWSRLDTSSTWSRCTTCPLASARATKASRISCCSTAAGSSEWRNSGILFAMCSRCGGTRGRRAPAWATLVVALGLVSLRCQPASVMRDIDGAATDSTATDARGRDAGQTADRRLADSALTDARQVDHATTDGALPDAFLP